jgi:y4mF family transcriptional regulator
MATKKKASIRDQSRIVILSSPAAIGAAAREAREAKGLTQDEVANKARVSRKFVIDVENGKESLHLGKALKVLMAAGLVAILVPADAMKGAG